MANLSYTDFLARINNGAIFTACFIKRGDDTNRVMNCRVGVTKYLHGGTLAYDPAAYNLLNVFDMKKPGYRMINLETLYELRFGGRVYGWNFDGKFFFEKRIHEYSNI